MVGPFGSLWGANWGEDASSTVGITNFSDLNSVIYTRGSNDYNSGDVTMFRRNGLLYIGDGGFLSQSNRTSISPIIEPFW
ncbi:hypothetical protein [Bacteroides reticulotermitis]|uniref:Uncharacterized protein n=2 Tax=Bacteroides reticulotermitis TaxID=1133319 RepID=W4UUC7_9BACE|nr:hypothetical protein [Bacteroides reticulotermitis]GAE84228.1 hypothetical protein JCM10512_2557 [Bacteroides reticulotermitis JCM 10512]